MTVAAIDLDALRRERDREVAALEKDATCGCHTRIQYGRWSPISFTDNSDDCWLHGDRRRTHLGIGRCTCCGAEEVAKRLDDGDWCRVCSAEAGPVSEPQTPTLTEF